MSARVSAGVYVVADASQYDAGAGDLDERRPAGRHRRERRGADQTHISSFST
jgi:hypothetical protein